MTISSAGQPVVSPHVVAKHRILVWAQTSAGRPLAAAADEIDYLRQLAKDYPIKLLVEVVENGYWADLPGHISRFRPTVLHYIGHGRRGSLLVLDRDSAGFPGEVSIGPDDFADILRGATNSLRGVFLNGCETAHWAPHLIPPDGWIVGMNHKIDDHLASEFSGNFYSALLDRGSSDLAFEAVLRGIQDHPQFTEGTIVRWTEDPLPNDFLHKVFSRQAFLTSALEEGSLLDLCDALKGVRQALKTRGLALRNDLGLSGQISCRTPLGKDIVTPLLARLKVAEGDLRQLRQQFPLVVKCSDGWMNVESEEIEALLDLADRLDRSRNELLRIVNQSLPTYKRLPMITLTSTTSRWNVRP
ncbi:CHAT domain-containing protein [Lacisediminihabitans sp. FW035]